MTSITCQHPNICLHEFSEIWNMSKSQLPMPSFVGNTSSQPSPPICYPPSKIDKSENQQVTLCGCRKAPRSKCFSAIGKHDSKENYWEPASPAGGFRSSNLRSTRCFGGFFSLLRNADSISIEPGFGVLFWAEFEIINSENIWVRCSSYAPAAI